MSETEVNTETQVEVTDDLDAFSTDFFGQKEVEVPKTEEQAEQEGEVDEGAGDTDSQVTDPEDDLDAEIVEEAPKKKTVQDRINELVKQREDIKRDADAKFDALRKEFEDFKKAGQPAVVDAKEPSPDSMKENGDPVYPLGEFDPNYIRDLAVFSVEQAQSKIRAISEQELREREQMQATQILQTEWNAKVEAATVEMPDFVEKGQELLRGFNNLDTGYAGYLSTVLMSMEQGPAVLYYLAEHPDEARTIVNSGAQRATLALGRIEQKFIEADAQKKLAKPKVSQTPPPPANRTRGTNGAFISVAPDTDDLDAFSREFFKKK